MKKVVFIIVDIICFIGGSSLFTNTIFDFSPSRDTGPADFGIGSSRGYGISYTKDQIFLLTIGIGLIVLGFLIRSWRKGK